jgi:hypothetical protein
MTIVQYDFDGRPIFQHRCDDKWMPDGGNRRSAGFLHEDRCFNFQAQLLDRWTRRPNRPYDHATADPAMRQAAEGLCDQPWFLRRDGFFGEAIRLRLDGRIARSAVGEAWTWNLRRSGGGQLLLAICGESGVLTSLARAHGRWFGRIRVEPNRTAELLPAADRASAASRSVAKTADVRIAVASMFTPEFAQIRELAEPDRIAYCRRHDYDYLPAYRNLCPTRPAVWSKIPLLLEHLPRYDWIFWLDADALILNGDVPLERLLEDDADLIIGSDLNGINAGVFFIRNTPASVRLLEAAWDRQELLHHVFQEQEAIRLTLLEHRSTIRVLHARRRSFNAYPNEYRDDTFIVHFPGIGDSRDRLQSMRQVAAEFGLSAGTCGMLVHADG